MNTYNNSLKIKDALQVYFAKYHFANGGYDLKWFKIKLGFVYLPFPNTKSRVDAAVNWVAVRVSETLHGVTG